MTSTIQEKEELNPLIFKEGSPSFALKLYYQGCANSWYPKEVSLAGDKAEFDNKLTDIERHYLKYMLGFFCTSESLVANNISYSLYKSVKNSEWKVFLLRQAYEEANHAISFLYILESLGLDRNEIFDMYKTIPAIKAKKDFEEQFTLNLLKCENPTDADLLKNLFGFYAIMEGLFFFSGFLIGLSFGRRQLLKGTASITQYILKDETVHLGFGMQAMRELIKNNPNLLTDELKQELINLMIQAVELEKNYAEIAMPEGILGLNKNYYTQYCQYIADRRLQGIGLEPYYKVSNPAPWLTTQTDLPELVSFFEASSTNYETNSK
jgi:ribonucleoside-diphosphate reductase beta chain